MAKGKIAPVVLLLHEAK